MADDTGSKIIIEIDADTGKFTTKLNGVDQQLKTTSKDGSSGFNSMMLAVTGVNQALELGQKVLGYWEMAIDNMAKTEAWKNQETALKNVGSQVGLNAKQIQTLTDLIIKSTDGTITKVQATETAFRLLNAGFKSETIPSLTKYAELLEKARGIPFDQTIAAFERALITGNTRGLKPFEIQLDKTGTTAQVTQAIMNAVAQQTTKFGDGYVDTAAKIKAKSEETWNSVKKFFGGITESVAFEVFADKTDRATLQLEKYKKALADVEAQITKGNKQILIRGELISVMPQKAGQMVEIEKVHLALLEKINLQQDHVTTAKKEEVKQEQKSLETIKQKGELLKALTPQLANKEAIIAQLKVEDEYYKKGESSAEAHLKAQTQMIQLHYQEEIAAEAAKPQTVAQFRSKIIELEREKWEELNNLRVQDTYAAETAENTKLAMIQSHQFMIENSAQEYQNILLEQEKRRYEEEINNLKLKAQTDEEYDQIAEQREIQHQLRMQQIIQSHNKLTNQNIALGWHDAMTSMNKEWGSWATVTQKMATQTHNVMSKSFIEMAKAHKFSMDMLVNNFAAMVGETLIQKGTADLLMSIWPPNPVGLATGAAEIAMGAALVGATSSASSTGVGSASAATGGYGGVGPTPLTSQDMHQKSAQIIINGDYLNSRETANHLAEVIRQNSDITNYAIVAQGQTY